MKNETFLYFLVTKDETRFKIGLSQNISLHIKQLGGPGAFSLDRSLTVEFPTRKDAHRAKAALHFICEPYSFTATGIYGYTDWFQIEGYDTALDSLKNLLSLRRMPINKLTLGVCLIDKPARATTSAKPYIPLSVRRRQQHALTMAITLSSVRTCCNTLRQYRSNIRGIDFTTRTIDMHFELTRDEVDDISLILHKMTPFISFPHCSTRLINYPGKFILAGDDRGMYVGDIPLTWSEEIDRSLNSQQESYREYANLFITCLKELQRKD